MREIVCKITRNTFIMICFMLLGTAMLTVNTEAAETNRNPLLEGIEIAGPDYVYEYEESVSFTLNKADYNASGDFGAGEDEYAALHYEWSSTNENVATFYETKYYEFFGCIGRNYKALERPNIFHVKSGETTICCTISDDEGNSVTISKNLTVIKETPIKALQLGKYKVLKEEVNFDKGNIYTNDIAKNLKLSLTLEDGWKLISESTISIDKDSDYVINIKLKNENLGREFSYRLYIYRYKIHTIDLKEIKEGYALVKRSKGQSFWSRHEAIVVKYTKDSSILNPNQFKSGEELVEKFKEYYDYDVQSVSYNNGIFTYKETSKLPLWIYCQNQIELDNAIANAKVENPLLYGLSIEGPDYIYETQKNVKFYISKSYGDVVRDQDYYSVFSFWWKSDNRKVAKFSPKAQSKNNVVKYPNINCRVLSGVKNGKVTIRCTISYNSGKKFTLLKEVTVLKGSPIKKLQIGNCKLVKSKRYATKGKIYTKKDKVRLKISLKKNWKVKKIRVYVGNKGKTVTKKKAFEMKNKKKYKVFVELINRKTGQTYSYECNIRKYKSKKKI